MINHQADLASIYTDFNGLEKLRGAAANASPETKREVAQQFEGMFVQMMLKSMRQASGERGILDGPQSEMYRDMYDQQIAIQLSKQGAIGIGDLLLRQLGEAPETPESKAAIDQMAITRSAGDTPHPAPPRSLAFAAQLWNNVKYANLKPHADGDWSSPASFISSLRPAAEHAARELGTRAEAILAIAALETGWGKHVMSTSDGASSNNLFGIKATPDWRHGRVLASTLEFEGGAMHRKQEPFRTYSSPADSVHDFAEFIQQNPRYQKALDNAANPARFIEEIHKAGYATDPDYSQKVKGVMRKITASTQVTDRTADKG